MPPCFVGLDIAKGHIDVSVRPTGEHWQVSALKTSRTSGWVLRRASSTSCSVRGWQSHGATHAASSKVVVSVSTTRSSRIRSL